VKRPVALVAVLLAACCTLQAEEPIQARLLRTVQIGAPQGLTDVQIKAIVEDPKTDFPTFFLARSALLVLHEEVKGEGFDNLLTRVLNTPLASGNEYPQPPGLQAGFGGKELVFTMVYAMVMSGQQERAVDLLEKHLFTGSYYKQAVVLQALRNIGTQRAKGLIQKYQEKGDYHNLAENTLVVDSDCKFIRDFTRADFLADASVPYTVMHDGHDVRLVRRRGRCYEQRDYECSNESAHGASVWMLSIAYDPISLLRRELQLQRGDLPLTCTVGGGSH